MRRSDAVSADITSVPEGGDAESFGYKREVVWPSLGLTRVVPLSDEEALRVLAGAAESGSAVPARWMRIIARYLRRLAAASPEARAKVLGRRSPGPKAGRAFDISLHYAVLCELRGCPTVAAIDAGKAWGINYDSVQSSRHIAEARQVMEYVVGRALDRPSPPQNRRKALTAMERDLRATAKPRRRRPP